MEDIVVYGVDSCTDTQRTRRKLEEDRIQYKYVNLEHDPQADAQVKQWNGGRRLTPTVVISGPVRTIRVSEPSNDELTRALVESGIRRAA